jgi:hypothetical protein
VDRIPQGALDGLVDALNAMPFHTFPIAPEETAKVKNPWCDTGCHCQVGTMVVVLSAAGVDVSARLPWMRRWLSNYRMGDGGLNCDESAYLVNGECPSSMVATVAIGEALLSLGSENWTEQEREAACAIARFLVGRKLVRGSVTHHNAEERAEAVAWQKLCFPRFYHYDVLRGLSCLVKLSLSTGIPLAIDDVSEAVGILQQKAAASPLGLCIERCCFERHRTIRQDECGVWTRGHEARLFPLLELFSSVGEVSQELTSEWEGTARGLEQLGLSVSPGC